MTDPESVVRWLIILRGVPGVGKSAIAKGLIRQLDSRKVYCLNMDEIRPIELAQNINASLQYDYVIAHVYSGRRNVSEPTWWISRFKDAGYHIISFRLEISREAGKKRCLSRPGEWLNEAEYLLRWDRFQRSPFTDFAQKAAIEEIAIDAETNSEDITCAEILNAVRERGIKSRGVKASDI